MQIRWISGILLSLVFSLTSSLSATAAELDSLHEGQQAFNDGNYALSFARWQAQARQGVSDAQVFVGLSYANGWGVQKNLALAGFWYKKAAINHNSSAQLLLGLHYLLHREDMREAGVIWLIRAANAGEQQARDFLDRGKSKGWFKDIRSADAAMAIRHSIPDQLALAKTDSP